MIRGLSFEWNRTQLKFKPGTVKENMSTIGRPVGIEPIRFCDAAAMLLSLSYRGS